MGLKLGFLCLGLGLILNFTLLCEAGVTSGYVRKILSSESSDIDDMPLDSDVFRVPPGYNAPQQVLSCLPNLSFSLKILFLL